MQLTKWRIAKIIEESPFVKTWRLAPLGHGGMKFKPGQFVLLHLLNANGLSRESRPYSISSSPNCSDHIDLTIRHTPNFPARLAQFSSGETVGITGPFGMFTLDESKNDCVFIAAGIGVAGIMSKIRNTIENKLPHKMILLYSERHRNEFIWTDEFLTLKKRHSKFDVVLFVTQEKPSDWNEEIGRIDEARILKYTGDNPQSKFYYICGSPEFTEAIEAILLGADVPSSQIKYEKWGGISSS